MCSFATSLMEMHGSLTRNLQLAVESSRRLSGHPIHKDTLSFWSDLIRAARSKRAAGEDLDDPALEAAIRELELVLAQRHSSFPAEGAG